MNVTKQDLLKVLKAAHKKMVDPAVHGRRYDRESYTPFSCCAIEDAAEEKLNLPFREAEHLCHSILREFGAQWIINNTTAVHRGYYSNLSDERQREVQRQRALWLDFLHEGIKRNYVNVDSILSDVNGY